MTFYLKYRPKTISELDLPEVREQLKNILGSSNIPHAFLFAGPRGSGKTSAARILAKAVNCEGKGKREKGKNANIEPCNKCAQCEAIVRGASLDVLEIDAASHRGVDDVRALRDAVKLAPAGASKKVYIIDEAHMLTLEAANALLKTLEEPPDHVLFILATTAPEKLPDTIRSRCTIINFRKADSLEIVASLKKVVEGEGINVSDDALSEIVKIVDGSFREAHKILEQLSLGKKKITVEDVKNSIAVSRTPENLLLALSEGKTKEALEEIDIIVKDGVNLRLYTSQLVGLLRNILLSEFTNDGRNDLKAKDLEGVEKVKFAIELFSKAALDIPSAVIPQLPLEMAVIEWVGGSEGLLPTHLSLNSATSEGTGSRDSAPSARRRRPLEPASDNRDERSSASSPSLESLKDVGGKIPLSTLNLDEQWKKLMEQAKKTNHSIEALLRATKPQGLNGNNLMLEVFYQFHKERIEKDPYRSLVEKIAQEVFGKEIHIVCFLSSSKKRAIDIANLTEEVEEDIIRVAEDIFGGKEEKKLPN
ncbi:MAG: DNA polymerase III subunit gamma/tau [Candidatus Blackburnbacteria bacterium]|nr:DNA polymerase III subunit gamma/tau [Candidatus Blackburnbacteria bacterium]